VEWGNTNRGIEIKVGTEKGGEIQPSPKKPRTGHGEKTAKANL
jgi:hypothetical protein